ncbi:hypothetical protein AB0N92_13220 [Streptomyces sp. NPDC093248]|uniref:hypothetical protein n=1 Tax=Streptomyces sp. NPDC093248 TaxID=3155072 RepID=UPI003425C136
MTGETLAVPSCRAVVTGGAGFPDPGSRACERLPDPAAAADRTGDPPRGRRRKAGRPGCGPGFRSAVHRGKAFA